jgi:hypothetical protein
MNSQAIVDLPVQLAFQFSPLDVPNGPCVRATEAHRADDIYFSNLDTASECARARESGDWLGQRRQLSIPFVLVPKKLLDESLWIRESNQMTTPNYVYIGFQA